MLKPFPWIRTARAIRSVGWSFAELTTTLPWVQSEITNLEARRSLFCPSAATGAVDGIDFDSFLSQLDSASPNSTSFSPLSSGFSTGVPSTPNEFATHADLDALLASFSEDIAPEQHQRAVDGNPDALGIGAAAGATAIGHDSHSRPRI